MTEFTILFALLALLASYSWAAQYSVNTIIGVDTNPGSASLPWATISKAASVAGPGDLVTVNEGNYNEQPTFSRSGTSGNMITFKASGQVVTKGFIIQGDYICVDGFEAVNMSTYPILVQGNHDQVLNFYAHDSGLPVYCTGSYNQIQKGKMYRLGQDGVWVEGSNNSIIGNEISHILQYPPGGPTVSSPDANGIVFFGLGHIIKGNWIHDIVMSDPGQIDPHIDCFQTWGSCSNITFDSNKCYIPDDGMQGWQINAGQALSGLQVINNVIYAFRGGNFWNTPGIVIANNLFATNPGFTNPSWYGVELHNSPGAVLVNNGFVDYPPNYFYADSASNGLMGNNGVYQNGGTYSGASNPGDVLNQNPLFVNPANIDYHLQAGSPWIGSGQTVSAVTHDFDGICSPQGSAYSIGPFGYTKSPSNSTTTPIGFVDPSGGR